MYLSLTGNIQYNQRDGGQINTWNPNTYSVFTSEDSYVELR